MSEIIYNGTKVDSAIKQINTQLNSYDSIIDNVLSLTNSLVNIKGFDIIPEAAGVSRDTYSSLLEDCKDTYKKLINKIRNIQIIIMKYSQGDEYIDSFLNSMSNEEWNTLFGSTLAKEDFVSYLARLKGNVSNTSDILNKESASNLAINFKTVALNLASSVLGIGEGVYDIFATGTGMLKAFTTKDLAYRDAILEQTRAKTEYDWTKSVVNDWIETSDYLADIRYFRRTNMGVYSDSSVLEHHYVNDYDPANLPSQTLYDCDGVLTFYQNGKYVKETFCPDSLKHSYDLKLLVIARGKDEGYWIRDDGVQMFGKYALYGGNIPHWGGANPTNSTQRRGDEFYGTSGPGLIVGYGGTSEDAAAGRFYYHGQKVDVTYDVYTRWQSSQWGDNLAEYTKYHDRYYSKDESYATRNVINNPPLDASLRYYIPNSEWVSFFNTYPEFRPAGTENVTDWVTYFQNNNSNNSVSL